MVSLGERLREERERLGLSQTQFGDLAHVTKKSQMLYEADQRSPKGGYLAAIAAQGVDVQYVLTGNRSVSSNVELVDLSAGMACIPMYDIEAAAGAGRSFEGEPIKTTLQFPRSELATQGLDPAQIVGVQVRGDSMDGTLADGDWVLVNRASRDPKQEGVFLWLVSGERRIKRVQRLAGGALYLISDNELYQPEMIKPQDMGDLEILGRCEIRIGRVV
ncbi:phage repressor protein C with HTH and peptisase S24 domain [Vreelandella songnenensis]|uniref:Phage repressor protein C with HTH and peptisase S24 domain n=1 Tax=Vreelandella songnenensis TaxID=1176243 RepID=A0A2T0V001_9GAMM|nr:LexA family transcriptional regulator [Halomonas songnenensis]PRY63481.1 phage repressor protein C with HTH and peptisase S24 domain [Halomonas songnenensis]